jgi:predicted nuclease with TOPRIM domain
MMQLNTELKEIPIIKEHLKKVIKICSQPIVENENKKIYCQPIVEEDENENQGNEGDEQNARVNTASELAQQTVDKSACTTPQTHALKIDDDSSELADDLRTKPEKCENENEKTKSCEFDLLNEARLKQLETRVAELEKELKMREDHAEWNKKVSELDEATGKVDELTINLKRIQEEKNKLAEQLDQSHKENKPLKDIMDELKNEKVKR